MWLFQRWSVFFSSSFTSPSQVQPSTTSLKAKGGRQFFKSMMVWFEITIEQDHITGRKRASHCVHQALSSPRLALPPSSWLLYRLSSMWSATTITITTTTITTTMTTTITTTTWTSMKMMQQCKCECGYNKFMHFE